MRGGFEPITHFRMRNEEGHCKLLAPANLAPKYRRKNPKEKAHLYLVVVAADGIEPSTYGL